MNTGLLGAPVRPGVALAVHRSALQSIGAGGARLASRHPFGMPCLNQLVLKCTAAIGGFAVGDQWHQTNGGGNSTVNSTDVSTVMNDGETVQYQAGGGGNNSSMTGRYPDGTGVYIPASNFIGQICVLGPVINDDPGVATLPFVRRFTTPLRPYAHDTLYSEVNLLERPPAYVNVLLKCRQADLGYAFGDVVEWFSYQANISYRIGMYSNEKAVRYRTVGSGDAVIPHAQTGTVAALTPANWQLYMEVIG
jgi:hypothetical protein